MGAHKHDFYYYPATNEAGWKCCACDHRPGEPPGFSPELDRAEIDRKVDGLLRDLHEAKLVYVSNGDMGDGIAYSVARRCVRESRYDQYTIVGWLIAAFGDSHAKYWSEISEGIIAGKDPRPRCHCGNLATSYGSGGNSCSFEHSAQAKEGVPF